MNDTIDLFINEIKEQIVEELKEAYGKNFVDIGTGKVLKF